MTTTVPAPTFGATGFIIPTEAEILAGTIADINNAFGGALNPALSTPQGQLASSMAAIIAQADDTFLYYTTQVDPAFAMGRMQDAIGRIYFIERLPSQPTVLQVECSGLAGVIITVGALIKDAAGNIYSCTDEAEIASNGNVTTNFANQAVGPIAVPASDGVAIYQAIPGWDSVTCLSGVVGNDVESRSEFEDRRKQSVAINSIGSLNSVLGAVLTVDGVLDAYVTENDLGTSATVGGVLLDAHSIYVAAVGGLASEVAKAIWSKKAPGCAYNGNTTETVEDDNSGYNPPFPSYEVKFERPSSLQILFAVTLVNSAQVPANAATLIQNAIIDAFSGGDGGSRARIGSTVYASRYYSAIAALGSWAQVISLLIGSQNVTQAQVTAAIAGSVMTVSAVASGALAVGQTISDDALEIPAGTRIASLGTGSGGVGTYNLNIAAPVSSRTVYAERANATQVVTRIDQVPVIDANNIQVTLV